MFRPVRSIRAMLIGTRRLYSLKPPVKTIWNQRLAHLDALFLTGVTRFHEITGYSEIEKMKHELQVLEEKVSDTRTKVREAREYYNECLTKRSSSQSEMNELLMRKQTWLPSDLERFTQLYKDDHEIQLRVRDAKQKYDEIESELEDLQLQSGKLIGARYREEQLWSDKIRQASTWGTWVLMGINILLFVTVQLILEPWKRRRLVRAFESKVESMLDERENAAIIRHEEVTKQPVENHNSKPLYHNTDHKDYDKSALQWSNVLPRLNCSLQSSQPVELRPIEVGALTLASGTVIMGLMAGCQFLISTT